jgi:DNA polymerase-3 subunit alpha
MPAKFIHLHTHSHFSLLNALPKIKDLVKTAKENNMPALALTDAGAMYGAIEFYKECKKQEVKPIIGVDFYVASRGRLEKQSGVDNRRFRLVLLAKNHEGYQNLIKLVTYSFFEGFYYKPRIDRELIEKYSEGLVCIMPHFSGESSIALKNTDTEKARNVVEWYKKIFGDDFYLEITHHPEIEGQLELKEAIKKLAKETGAKLVAAHDVYYLRPEDKAARDTLVDVNSHADFADRAAREDTDDFSFITEAQALEYFKNEPDALENSVKIADECNLELVLGQAAWKFPNFIVESGLSHDDELKRITLEGINYRGLPHSTEVMTRLEYELEVIKNKGYAKYFLVVADLLKYATDHGIYSNIRGSVAGSMVTYLTGITKVNPLEYKLPFERFLNPERPSAPDIDMDFADNRRDEVIDYVRGKYGKDNVAQIGTFGTMMARGAVRDVARALKYPLDLADKIAKLIPFGAQGFPMTIERALKEVPELKEWMEKDADVKRIIEMAKKIEGCARHISVHAAGVVISPDPLINYVPLQYDAKDEHKIITQYDMNDVGEDGVGLLKFDFLGIRNLSILADAVDRVKKIENLDIDIEKIPLDDKLTYDMLSRGDTIGVFQLNGSGMTKYLKELKPATIFDINAMVALYRPGPIEMIPEYIERKNDSKKVKYFDPRMKDYLDQSFGLIVYQDDVMLTAIELGGYSWLEADKLRKAMGKKIPAEMAAQKEKLIAGLIKNGMTEKKAGELWKLIEPFAAYGFNKAHAASYGRVSYQTAYMKGNFPAIYLSAVLTADSGDVEKVAETITEAKKMGIPVLPPSVNESFSQFTVVKTPGVSPHDTGENRDKIRFGLMTIKNFGEEISHAIIRNRKEKGKFKSLSDFLERIIDKNLNKRSLEALIKAGALDEFAERGVMLGNIEKLLTFNKEASKHDGSQDSLFGMFDGGAHHENLRLDSAPEATPKEKLEWEKDLLGLYISGHPLDKFRKILEKQEINIKRIKEETDVVRKQIDGGKPIGGILEDVRIITTKNNEPMAFLKIADFTGSIEAVAFPRTYSQYKNILVPDKCIAAVTKISERNGEISLVLDKVKALE